MATVQSHLSANQSNPSPIDLADRAQRRIFVASVIFGVLAAIVAALLAWLLWRANNTYQATVKADADARILEARAEASKAIKGVADANLEIEKAKEGTAKALKDAAEVNERAQNLEKQNIQLRTDLEAATAESRAKQTELAKEQTKLAGEQKKTADAQRAADEARLALQKHLEYVGQRQQRQEAPRWPYIFSLFGFLKDKPKGTAEVLYVRDDEEAYRFAQTLASDSSAAGWRITRIVPLSADDPSQLLPLYSSPDLAQQLKDSPLLVKVGGHRGITLISNKVGGAPLDMSNPLDVLTKALLDCGFTVRWTPDGRLPDSFVRIVVGPKE